MKRSGGNRRQARLGNVNGPGREISRAGPEKFFEKIRISLNRFPENANTTNSYKRGNEYLSSPFLYLACSPSAAGGVFFGFSLIFQGKWAFMSFRSVPVKHQTCVLTPF